MIPETVTKEGNNFEELARVENRKKTILIARISIYKEKCLNE